MKRILFFASLTLVLLSSCGKENDLQPKGDFLDDLLGLYVGEMRLATSEEIVTYDGNGNVIDVTTVTTDSMYVDTVEFIREQADSTFSFVADDINVGPLKWNEDNIYNFTYPRQGVDLEIELYHDPVAESLDLTVYYYPSDDVNTQPSVNRKYNFIGNRQ